MFQPKTIAVTKLVSMSNYMTTIFNYISWGAPQPNIFVAKICVIYKPITLIDIAILTKEH